jgi:hypothetical protein
MWSENPEIATQKLHISLYHQGQREIKAALEMPFIPVIALSNACEVS